MKSIKQKYLEYKANIFSFFLQKAPKQHKSHLHHRIILFSATFIDFNINLQQQKIAEATTADDKFSSHPINNTDNGIKQQQQQHHFLNHLVHIFLYHFLLYQKIYFAYCMSCTFTPVLLSGHSLW